MTWYHYTSTKIKYIKTNFEQLEFTTKPNGLWCSYNDEWLKFCIREHFTLFNTNNYYLYEIEFNPDAKILHPGTFKMATF
jgi:hypothetical protein